MHPRMYPSYRGAHANRGRKTESSERCLRAERGGKRLWLTRRRRLRTGREATLRSDEFRVTGAASGEAPLRCTESPACRWPRAVRHRSKVTGAPQLRAWSADRRRHRRRHGQPGQRERRQASGPGNRVRVQLRQRRVGQPIRPGRGAPSPGNRRWRRGNGVGQPTTGPQRASPAEPSGTTGDV